MGERWRPGKSGSVYRLRCLNSAPIMLWMCLSEEQKMSIVAATDVSLDGCGWILVCML